MLEAQIEAMFRAPEPRDFILPPALSEHAKGKTMVAQNLPKQSDIDKLMKQLNRKILTQTRFPSSLKDLEAAYCNSAAFKDIYQFLRYNKLPTNRRLAKRIEANALDYYVLGTLLFKYVHQKSGDVEAVLCIPASKIDFILDMYHGTLIGGHQGMNKTLRTLSSRYYCPRLADYIRAYIVGCHTCQLFKNSKRFHRPLQKRTYDISQPALANVSMDIKYMPKSNRGQKVGMSLNEMHQLEREFLLYGEYNVNSTTSIINLLDSLDDRTSNLERILEMKIKEWTDRFYDFSSGPAMYSHMFQLYIDNLREKYIRLYEALETELNLLLRSIAILSKGYLPPQLFPPTSLVKISQKAIAMIKTKNPDYVLALPHITDYYDMRLVTFGLDDQGKLVICFPIFIKEYQKEPMTLYQIETVKVSITDTNTEVDSYTETAITKPYLASNKEYYTQLVLPELVMCKKIRGTFYCEELFLVKYKTKLSCESAIFYNLTRDVILENCKFNYYYNTTVLPSILDGGSHILLANMLNPKRLICSYDQGLAKPLPTSSYALVSRDILCYCCLQIGLTYILKSIASCNVTTTPTLEYTVNLAFMDYFQSFWTNDTLSHIPLLPSMEEIVLPVAMEDYTKDPLFLLYGKDIKRNPNTLAELSQIIHQKQAFLKSRKELFSKPKADIRLPETPLSKRSESSFLFSAIFHIYIFVGSSVGILWLIPCIVFALKQRKMKTLVSAMALHQAKPIEAVAASISVPAEQTEALITTSVPSLLEKLTGMDIPTNHMTKLVCQDPWVSFIVTVITIVGVVVYVYRSCRHMTFLKGHKFASICHVHIIFCKTTLGMSR